MNFYILKKLIITTLLTGISVMYVSAAQITIVAPEVTSALRKPVTIQVFLDTEDVTVSGIGGNLSFPTELFDIESMTTESSIVPLWVVQPSLSDEKNFDARTHVVFEGIFPGGYNGVRSPYYKGTKPGILFMITLIPKNKGTGLLSVDDIVLNAFDSKASPIQTNSAFKAISVPDLVGPPYTVSQSLREVKSSTLTTIITRDQLINNNAWYLIVNERENRSSVESVSVAETDDWSPHLVQESLWRNVRSPHVLIYQNRTKYVHVKVRYSNKTYALQTLPPVENYTNIASPSRILLGIGLAIFAVLAVLYMYVKQFIRALPKNE